MTQRVCSLGEIAEKFDVILCDVWGVLHHGVKGLELAEAALTSVRQAGATVILLTNSPRPSHGVMSQLRELGISDQAYDRIVTSGDVCRQIVAAGPSKIFLIGPKRNSNFFDGLHIEVVPAKCAEVVVCTGLINETDVPANYADLLKEFADRKIDLICANPDLSVKKGNEIIPCAGAIAAYYEQIGGRSILLGKPHSPIYHEALTVAREERGDFEHSRVLAIGDGMLTDARGALAQGLEFLYIAGGVHSKEYSLNGAVDDSSLIAWLHSHETYPKYWMPALA
ncbi:TIGR01459 family HAD-type hydrolase [Agrobacterium sp. SORGH_AS 787]|uniref:TIGR01459 family HAD-type hydrolase n=1 Tax=Agrobacterium sp. SORGH_AS 787 TaxID=3041775 RepID=UPI002780C992|nr:HAD superfamily hydrolase (TIGR01459 family) [Rhizobium sp. SORGH_AS_0787]